MQTALPTEWKLWVSGAKLGGQQLAAHLSSGTPQAETGRKHDGWLPQRFQLVEGQTQLLIYGLLVVKCWLKSVAHQIDDSSLIPPSCPLCNHCLLLILIKFIVLSCNQPSLIIVLPVSLYVPVVLWLGFTNSVKRLEVLEIYWNMS